VVNAAIAVVERGSAHEDTRFGLCETRRRHTGIFERFPYQLQGQPLLGIHLFGFARRDRKYGGVGTPDVLQEARRERVRFAGLAFSIMEEASNRPTSAVDTVHRTTAFHEQAPERLNVVGFGKATGTSDYRDRGSLHLVPGCVEGKTSWRTHPMALTSFNSM